MKPWRRASIVPLVVGLCGVARGEPLADLGLSDPAALEPPELVALQADSSEEHAVSHLQRIGIEKQRLLERTELRGRAYVRLVRLGLLPLSDGFRRFVAHANRVESLRRGLARDLAAVAKLDAEARATREALRQLRARRERLVRDLDDYQRSRDAIMAAKEREAAYQRAFSAGSTPRHTAVYVSKTDADGVDSFPELKGQVPFPVRGRAEVRELDPTAERGAAVEMLVGDGSVARAVFKGRVVLIGDSSDGTHTVVIDHGSGYSTVSGNLRRVLVSVGDEVAAGAELGELGSTKGGRGLLHFEVRHDGLSLLPAEWFGI